MTVYDLCSRTKCTGLFKQRKQDILGGGVVFHTIVKYICLCFLESRLRKALISSATPHAFNSFFFSRARDRTTFTLHDLIDFYLERVTTHRIKINDHSCFHNRWPNSKTKLKLKHIWEQGGPWRFRGPTHLVYSAHRGDWLCCTSMKTICPVVAIILPL